MGADECMGECFIHRVRKKAREAGYVFEVEEGRCNVFHVSLSVRMRMMLQPCHLFKAGCRTSMFLFHGGN